MKLSNFGEKKEEIPNIESGVIFYKDDEENGMAVLTQARDRWLEIMKGKKSEEEGERIDFEKIIPDIEYFFGEKFTIKPGKWWMTSTVNGERTLFYPRDYGIVPKSASPEEKERQVKIQEGGVLHEMGHHAAVVKSLEAMMREADTGERILGDLSLGEAEQMHISQVIENQREELERMGTEMNVGPYVGNLMFMHDLQNVCLDIWLEAYLSKYPAGRFANEAREGLTALNRALFEKIPDSLLSNSLSGQFKSAILLRAMRPDLMVPKGSKEAWFKEGFVAPEVVEALKRMKKNKVMEALTDSEELSGIFIPEERLRWVKHKKLQDAYFAIRREFVNLMKVDFDRAVEKMAKKQKEGGGEQKGDEGEKGEKGKGEKQDGNGEGQEGGEEGEGEKEGIQSSQAGQGGSQEMPSGKPGRKGKGEEPISFDDLSAEQQAELINNFIDQMEGEKIGSSAISAEDVENNESLNQLSREAIERELQNRRDVEEEVKRRRRGEAEKKDKSKGGEKGDKNGKPEGDKSDEDPGKSARNTQRVAMENRIHEAQRHVASEMDRGKELGLSLEDLREFERKKSELDGKINYFRDGLIELFGTKLEPERKTHRPEGHLMSGHFSDYLRTVSRGEEPNTFEYLSFKQTIPSIDLLILSDHSGSMGGEKAEKAAEAGLLFSEAFIRAEEVLDKQYGGGRKKRDFLREGLITFSSSAVLQKPLDEPLNEKTVAGLYFGIKNISGGGTADAEAVKNLIGYLKEEKGKYHGRQKVLNVVLILTDGQGEKEKVQEVLKTAAELPNTLFVAVGVGSDTMEVLDTWKDLYGRSIAVAIHIPDEKIPDMPQEIITGMKNSLRTEFAKL